MDPRDIQELRRKAVADFQKRKTKGKRPMPPPAPTPVPIASFPQTALRISEGQEVRPPVQTGSGVSDSQERIQRLLDIFDPHNSIGSRVGSSKEAACRAVLEMAEQLVHFIGAAETSQEVALALEERTEEMERLSSLAQSEAAAAKEALKGETERANELSARIKKSAFKVGADKEALKKARQERDETSRSAQANLADVERLHQAALAELRSELEKSKADAENHKQWFQEELLKSWEVNRELHEELLWANETRDKAEAEARAARHAPVDEAEIRRLTEALSQARHRNSELSAQNTSMKDYLDAFEVRSAEQLRDNERLASLHRAQEERLDILESLAEARGTVLAQVQEELREAQAEMSSLWARAYSQGFEECRSVAAMLCPERSKDFIQIPLNEPPISSVEPDEEVPGKPNDAA